MNRIDNASKPQTVTTIDTDEVTTDDRSGDVSLPDVDFTPIPGADSALVVAMMAIKMGRLEKKEQDSLARSEEAFQRVAESREIKAMEDKALVGLGFGIATSALKTVSGAVHLDAATYDAKSSQAREGSARGDLIDGSLCGLVSAVGSFVQQSSDVTITREKQSADHAATAASEARKNADEAGKLVEQGLDAVRQYDAARADTMNLLARA